MSRVARLAVVCLLVAGAVGPAVGAVDDPADSLGVTDALQPSRPGIGAVYPNPVADGDRGEFVVLDAPNGTDLGDYRLSDGDGALVLPNRTVGGRVAVTTAPGAVRNLTRVPVVAANGSVALANGGERLRLRRGNTTVARARYREAPEGKIGRFDDRGAVTWRPLGRTDRPIVAATGGEARAFTLPDAPSVPLDVLRGADRRILLAGYTFTSDRVARALERAERRGADVRVLLDGEPVDGITRRQARLLDSLVDAGVTVKLLGGPHGRYAFHHPKYAVADDRAVVLTENWKPSGTGGHASRGWGAVVSQPRIVDGLAETFRADAEWRGARPWSQVRLGRSFERAGVANGSYPSRRSPETVAVNRTRLLVAPDNAGRAVTAALDGADDSIDVLQMSIDGPDQRFLRATVRAARRGVDVRVLLSGAWYVEEENRRLVEHLREVAEREGLSLEAKLAEPEGDFEKIHAKGVVIDGDRVLVGSLNWNGESIEQNREVVLSLEGEAVGEYYRGAFEADWGGGAGRSLPVGIVAGVAGCLVLAILVARRIDFGENVGVGG
ncbi:phospholipase D-like domain-containing protein [Halosimplex pelagicum]|uniref:Phospholipase n=1 Tax=Halosimplex pelagicum TaxID=869886 RepID=A0A7D5PCZ2_9EURY|nr:phospholipase D-like domain-containing protein [Halosimplex pelagicum]QLH82778.1 phospholipase [Halosimplex pelagicum]